jgi:homocysteine S-methyltransferase
MTDAPGADRSILRRSSDGPRAPVSQVWRDGDMNHTTTATATPPTRPADVFPDDGVVVTDGGLETWLVFHRNIDLPAFAAYPLVGTDEGREVLAEYVNHYVDIALDVDAALDLETPTWRANPEWAATLGHGLDQLGGFIDASVELAAGVRSRWTGSRPLIIGGTVGPRGDGYVVGATMTADQAADYHSFQIRHMARAGIDVVTALTIGYPEEAIGIVQASHDAGVPAVISFTVETDGRLPSGITLREAIEATDAATDHGPEHYMVNCAHPTHFADVFVDDGADRAWLDRIGGLRSNASRLSHAELDEMTELDDGDPDDLARRYVDLRRTLPNLRVLGGCCGTDHRHVDAIARACAV